MKHYLNNRLIPEPIGFDGLKMILSRHEYHGVGAAFSVNDLEFYAAAFDIIKDAYDSDIGTPLPYSVRTDQGATVLDAVVDLTTCEFSYGDYKSVKCKIGDVGIKTAFQNRAKTEFNIMSAKTADGTTDGIFNSMINVVLPSYPLIEKSIFAHNITQGENFNFVSIYQTINAAFVIDQYTFVKIPFDTAQTFGNSAITTNIAAGVNTDTTAANAIKGVTPLFVGKKEDYHNYFINTKWQVNSIRVTFAFSMNTKASDIPAYKTPFSVSLIKVYSNGSYSVIQQNSTTASYPVASSNFITCSFDNIQIDTTTSDSTFSIGFLIYPTDPDSLNTNKTFSRIQARMYLYFDKTKAIELYVTRKGYSTDTVIAPTLPLNYAVNHLVQRMMNGTLAYGSYYYYYEDAQTGYLDIRNRLLTTGYMIRGYDYKQKPFTLSWESLIKNAAALDNIGWGWYYRATDGWHVRIELYSWWYKSDVIATFTNIKDVKRAVDTDRCVAVLKCGYKKYYASETQYTLDNIFSERTWQNLTEALSTTRDRQCEWIADNYAIEHTRREAIELQGEEEGKYDENIFVLYGALENGQTVIPTGVSSDDLETPKDVYNYPLSPAVVAMRLIQDCRSLAIPDSYVCVDGKQNYKAVVNSIAQDLTLRPDRAIFNGERVTCTVPMTPAQYNAINMNPYGIIKVNGLSYWLDELQYQPAAHTAALTLIPCN